MNVCDALVESPLTVSPGTTLFELIDLILGGNQTTAAVVEDGRLLGTVSAVDVLQRLVPSYVSMDPQLASVLHDTFFDEALEHLHDVRVGDVMTRETHLLSPTTSVMKAVAVFVRQGRKTLPVVEEGRYVGSVTRRSVLALIRKRAGA